MLTSQFKELEPITVGLIADHPNIVFEDVHKSLKGKFNLERIEAGREDYPDCDIFLFASNKPEKLLIHGISQKLSRKRDLVVISPHHEDLVVDRQTRVFYYPYKYDIIINLPLIVKTVFSASQVNA